ncbi:MAG TPA: hypothetical protein VLW17_05035 [Thermoanaerobaculaceae bacterium]|nr:hypothetical protein [Thermoanaerobaculaceae bacterium]
MRPPAARWCLIGALAALLSACQGPPEPASPPTPAAADEQAETVPLTAPDVRDYLAVRSKALQQMEDALADAEARGGDVVGRVQELSVAEHDAARSLGVEWRRFTAVRERVGRLLTAQRQRQDQRLLAAELTRAKQDLESQLQVARDPASRQFLEAQVKAIEAQLGKLDEQQGAEPSQAAEMALLESERAEIATLQGRQDRLTRRLQELIQRGSSAPATPAAPTPVASR